MSGEITEPRDDGALLSVTLRLIRKHRGMTKIEVAAAMNMPIRTYNRFEAGDTRLNPDYVHRFAAVTRSDPQAIHIAVSIGDPAFAVRACDNQLGSVLTIGLQNFNAELGDGISRLDSRTVVAAVIRMFAELQAAAHDADPTETWLQRGHADLRRKRPKPGR